MHHERLLPDVLVRETHDHHRRDERCRADQSWRPSLEASPNAQSHECRQIRPGRCDCLRRRPGRCAGSRVTQRRRWRHLDGNVLSQTPAAVADRSSFRTSLGVRTLLLSGLVLLALLVGGVTMIARSSRAKPAVSSFGATRAPSTLLTAAQTADVHDALHDLDARCTRASTPGATQAIAHDTDVIVAFSERYPDAVFPIDDETGRTLSLLLVARQSLRRCAPYLVSRIDALLPFDLRSSVPPKSGSS